MKRDISNYFNQFIYTCKYEHNLRKDTIRGYTSVFALFQKMTGIEYPGDVNSDVVRIFFRNLQERERLVGRGFVKKGIKPSTQASYWTKLNVFFSWLCTNQYIKSNPFAAVSYPRPVYEDRKYLSKSDIEKIFCTIQLTSYSRILLFKRNTLLFQMLMFCGLRKGELLGIQIRDIDFEARLLTIRAETSKSKRTRQIPLHSILMIHLKEYLKERSHYTTQYLFVSQNKDDRLTLEGFDHLIDQLKKKSGINFHAHQFRHTFAVNFLKSSNNIAKLQQLLGHRSIMMTSSYLRCLPPTEMQKDIEALSIDNFI